MTNKNDCGLILALDLETREEALEVLDHLGNSVEWVKIGLQLFTAYGPDFVREVAKRDYRIFLDLKLHDIPNTVEKGLEALAKMKPLFTTIHISGGDKTVSYTHLTLPTKRIV